MGIKCKNCGKLKKNHWKGVEIERGGKWCYSLDKVVASDKGYYQQYEEEVV